MLADPFLQRRQELVRARNVFDGRAGSWVAWRFGARWWLHELACLRFPSIFFDSCLTTNYSIPSRREQVMGLMGGVILWLKSMSNPARSFMI
jgi:hypothetical protein